MITIWSNILLAAFEGYVYVSFFCRVFRRKYSYVHIAPAYIAFIAGMCLLRVLEAKPLAFVLASLISVFVFSLFFSASQKQRILYAWVPTVLSVVMEIATGYILSWLYNQPINDITQGGLYIIGAAISKLAFLLLIRLICRRHHRDDAALPFSQWAIVMLMPVMSIIAAHGLGAAIAGGGCIIKSPTAALLILGGVIMMNALAFTIYDLLSGQSSRLLEHEKEKSHFDLEKQRYEAIIRRDREMGALVHETSRHMRVLSALGDSGDTDAMKEYIKKLVVDAQEVYDERIFPGYPAIDAVLRQKIAESHARGISVTHEIKLFPGLTIEPVDICVVLGNALDNAIEACARIEAERKINVRMTFTKNRLVIVIANTSNPVEIIDGACATTKEDKQAHGYGFSNIQKTINKYRGNMIPRYENGMFTLHILMLI